MWNSYKGKQEEKTNGAHGSKSRTWYTMDKDDTVRGGRFSDTLERRGST